ncbi:MAG TPA: DUF2235 domain-containing protein [Opitutaceae bacterium]|nr:DUF2235 domain-containing protein [Opitutaceae bacterium]
MDTASTPRNLFVCCDGTNNQFGAENTNVVRFVQILDRDPAAQQLICYDPGVGTLPPPTVWSWVGQKASVLAGLAFGAGIARNLAETYSFLMEQHRPGDRIFLLGFSRGAYTARALAGLLHHLGLLRAGSQNLVPYAIRLFRQINELRPGTPAANAYWRTCEEFRKTFARVDPSGPVPTTRCRTHFVGVWDTVSSVGWIWTPQRFPFTASNPGVAIFRHAVALDERRCFFRQNLWRRHADAPAQDISELWFPGVHSDVGGGYPERSGGLWRAPFLWMVREAGRAGARLDERRLGRVLARTPVPLPSWADRAHESLTPGWWPAELFPKFPRGWWPEFGLGRRRKVPAGALFHHTLLRRLRRSELGYRPRNVAARFVARLAATPVLPFASPYRPD